MSRRASATLIGAFVVGGIALILGAIIATGAGTVFKPKERAVMHFTGSAYGLQQGAPVVFRGVRVGSVTSIGLAYDEGSGIFSIPVVAELDPRMLRRLVVAEKAGAPLAALIDRGLRAQLSLQSFLTGLLYVDLDLRPDKPAIRFEREPTMVEIPTNATPIQALKEQLESVDLRRLVDDLSAIAASVRQLTGSPKLRDALADLAAVAAQAKALTAQLDRRIAPVMSSADATLAQTRSTLERVGGAADRIGSSADALARTADRVGALAAPDSPLVRSVQTSADELARAATALRQNTASDSGLVQNADRTLQDLARAARAVRELAELLERHPEALLRGRRDRGGADANPVPANDSAGAANGP